MRLSVLALFIALPAAVYAGLGLSYNCVADGYECDLNPLGRPCCPPAVCGPGNDPSAPNVHVCFIAHFLLFALGTKLNTGLWTSPRPAPAVRKALEGGQVMVRKWGLYAFGRRAPSQRTREQVVVV